MPIWLDCAGCGTNTPTHLPAYPPAWDSGITFVPPPAPTVTGIAPSSIPFGSGTLYLDVMGTGFTSASRILLDGVVAPTEYLSPTRLRTLLQPALEPAARAMTVTVHNGAVAATGSKTFNYTTPPAPVVTPHITDVNPTGMMSTDPDTTVHIMGTDFTETSQVYVNGVPVETTYVSPEELTYVAVGDSLGAHTVTIDGAVMRSGSAVFTVTEPEPPVGDPLTLTSLTPATGVEGTPVTITITGTGFLPTTTMTVSLTPKPVTYVSPTELTYAAPMDMSGFFSVELQNDDVHSGIKSFVVSAAPAAQIPTIAAVTPSTIVRAEGDQTISVTGTDFTADAVVRCSTKPEPREVVTTFVSATEVTFVCALSTEMWWGASNGLSVRTAGGESSQLGLTIT
jgi:hypothetical protein